MRRQLYNYRPSSYKQPKQSWQLSPKRPSTAPFNTRSEVILAMHERAKHTGTKTIKNDESKTDAKKLKRMETKFPQFSESETPSEFRRKTIEFVWHS